MHTLRRNLQPLAGAQRANVAIDRCGFRHPKKRRVVPQRLSIELTRYLRAFEQARNLGRERDSAIPQAAVIQRLLPREVPRKKQ